jgi:hypothetical protein
MTGDERHARKQVLLTRIAFQRDQLHREWLQVQHATEPRQLLRSLIGNSLGSTISRALFGRKTEGGGSDDLVGQALGWLRRYRVAATLVGGVAPLLRGAGRLRRGLRIAAIAGAAWLGWRFVRDLRSSPPAAK